LNVKAPASERFTITECSQKYFNQHQASKQTKDSPSTKQSKGVDFCLT
jgi:hypothetical protein